MRRRSFLALLGGSLPLFPSLAKAAIGGPARIDLGKTLEPRSGVYWRTLLADQSIASVGARDDGTLVAVRGDGTTFTSRDAITWSRA